MSLLLLKHVEMCPLCRNENVTRLWDFSSIERIKRVMFPFKFRVLFVHPISADKT